MNGTVIADKRGIYEIKGVRIFLCRLSINHNVERKQWQIKKKNQKKH